VNLTLQEFLKHASLPELILLREAGTDVPAAAFLSAAERNLVRYGRRFVERHLARLGVDSVPAVDLFLQQGVGIFTESRAA
jgi:hypothetical protein